MATATDGTTNISYAYDADGLRTSKVVNGVTHNYFYASGQLMRETYGNNTLDFFYDASGYPYALKYNGTTYYYIINLQGDVMYLVDANENTVASYEYDPYGNIVSATGTMAEINPLRYRGYYYDAELEMYYLQSRYYDPAICRFINADVLASTGQGVIGCNMFAYCNNNITSRTDPKGNASYSNTITKNKDGSYGIKSVISILWKKLTFNYYITPGGMVQFEFSKNDYWSVLWRGASKALAQAIYYAAKSIDKNFLSGRTIGGLDVELKFHYFAYTLGILRSKAEPAGMGGIDFRKTGFDYNAWYFEGVNAAQIVTDYCTCASWRMIRRMVRYL